MLPNFRSIGLAVSEEKIKMWKVNWPPSDGKSSRCLWQGELKILFSCFDYYTQFSPQTLSSEAI
jgi:hypothetical protein